MKMGSAFGAASLALALSLTAMPALARDLPPNGVTRQDIVNWLQSHGYTASIQHDTTANDDYVESAMNGVNYGIYFYACDTYGNCKSIQYSAGWDPIAGVDAVKLNQWNADKRYFRAYLNPQNDIYAEYDIDVMPGGTWELIDATLSRWSSQLASFKDFIGG